MRPELAADLRGWLEEPDFARMQREPLKLDAEQRKLITDWPAPGYRRVKGPAGSGKSVVLAARAAIRADTEKTVLILTFNITLWHYLKDLIVRALHKPAGLRSIIFDHFHQFCKIAALRAGYRRSIRQAHRRFPRDRRRRDQGPYPEKSTYRSSRARRSTRVRCRHTTP